MSDTSQSFIFKLKKNPPQESFAFISARFKFLIKFSWWKKSLPGWPTAAETTTPVRRWRAHPTTTTTLTTLTTKPTIFVHSKTNFLSRSKTNSDRLFCDTELKTPPTQNFDEKRFFSSSYTSKKERIEREKEHCDVAWRKRKREEEGGRERVSVLKFEWGFGWFLPKAYFQLPVVALSKVLRGLKKLLNALRKRNKKYLCFNFEWKRSRWKENGTTQS